MQQSEASNAILTRPDALELPMPHHPSAVVDNGESSDIQGGRGEGVGDVGCFVVFDFRAELCGRD